jgi:hydrogenase-4 membrane subunit HyfE
MTGLFIAFMGALLIPLFVATWRTSLLGLLVQGALMASLELRGHAIASPEAAVAIVDLVVVRAVAVPALIYLVLREHGAPLRNDVIAPNLFSWALALALVVMAFRSADVLVPAGGDEQAIVAVSASAFLLGLFVLSTSTGVFSQIIGLMRLENAITLYEIAPHSHREPLGVRVAQIVVLIGMIGFARWYLVTLSRQEPATSETSRTAL